MDGDMILGGEKTVLNVFWTAHSEWLVEINTLPTNISSSSTDRSVCKSFIICVVHSTQNTNVNNNDYMDEIDTFFTTGDLKILGLIPDMMFLKHLNTKDSKDLEKRSIMVDLCIALLYI
jgi:hypothetical protein